MVTCGLLVRLDAQPGKEEEVAAFLAGALPLAQAETGTTAWFALRLGPASFAIFDAFEDEAGRDAHLGGAIAGALLAQAPDLLVGGVPPIERADVLAAKL